MCNIVTHWQGSSLRDTCYNLKLFGSNTKTNLFATKNDKENKTNISLMINGKKDENMKMLHQKRTKVIFYIDNCLFEKNSKFLTSKSCSLMILHCGVLNSILQYVWYHAIWYYITIYHTIVFCIILHYISLSCIVL